MSVDGMAAAQTLLGFSGIRSGYCLYYVWQAYKANGASTGRSAGTATDAWYASDGQHPGDRNPPPGVPVFWGPKASSAAGDVTISLGGGRVAATEWPGSGVTGECSIDEREAQIGRPYLGWAECIFDQTITYPAFAGTEEDDMNTNQDAALSEAWSNSKRTVQLLENIENMLVGNGTAEPVQDGSALKQLANIHSRINFASRPDGTPYLVAVQGDIDQVLAAVAGVKSGTVDIDLLAARLSASLGADVAKALGQKLSA